jgi:hypothetical protein
MIVAQDVGSAQNRSDPAGVAFEEETGIRIVRVAMTAAGGLADIHYQVLDPGKASVVHDKDRPPTLVHEKTGAVLNTPFHSHVSDRELRVAVIYRLQLWNSGGALKRGDRVTVTVGEARLENIVVE